MSLSMRVRYRRKTITPRSGNARFQIHITRITQSHTYTDADGNQTTTSSASYSREIRVIKPGDSPQITVDTGDTGEKLKIQIKPKG